MQFLARIGRFDYLGGVWWSYRRLAFSFPLLRLRGLWFNGNSYEIWLDEEITLIVAGVPIQEWFSQNKDCFAPVSIVFSQPQDMQQITPPTLQDLARNRFDSRTKRDMIHDLRMALSPGFPMFVVMDSGRDLKLVFSVEPTEEQVTLLERVIGSFSPSVPLDLYIDQNLDVEKESMAEFEIPGLDLCLIPSSCLSGYPSSVRKMVERDDCLWLDNRIGVLGGVCPPITSITPESFDATQTRCFIDASVSAPGDIRPYLCVFDRISLAPPTNACETEVFHRLGVKPNELTELVRLGRVELILPQPIIRYNPRLIAELAESDQDTVILSRRLALLSVLESRRRVPILYPPLDLLERQAILTALSHAHNHLSSNPQLQRLIEVFRLTFSSVLEYQETLLNYRGAMAQLAFGLGRLLGDLVFGVTGNDLRLEFDTADSLVCWASALGASPIPSEIHKTPIVTSLSNSYTGLRMRSDTSESRVVYSLRENVIIEDLLVINTDVDVLHLARSFESGEIRRLRGLVKSISAHTFDEESIHVAVDDFNKDILAYEREKKKLRNFRIAGVVLPTALGLVFSLPVLCVVALEALANLDVLGEPLIKRHAVLSRFSDHVRSLVALHGDRPDAVLVSRLRSRIAPGVGVNHRKT